MINHLNKTITFGIKEREHEKTNFITAAYGDLFKKKK